MEVQTEYLHTWFSIIQIHIQMLKQVQVLAQMHKQVLKLMHKQIHNKAIWAQNRTPTHSWLNPSQFLKTINLKMIKIQEIADQDLLISSLTLLQKLRKDNYNESFIFTSRLRSCSRSF